MKLSKIEWTEATWNPSIGCDKISAGCRFCYAETFSKRLKAMGVSDYNEGFKFKIVPERLNQPLKIKKPTKFFVNSMSDLFHENMPHDYLDSIFDVIIQTPHHIYQILTKRDKLMLNYFNNKSIPDNVWIGVTVENNRNKRRIDSLRLINARVRFISFEPLLSSIDNLDLSSIHWAIVGGESGPRARKMKEEWVKNIHEQCREQNVAFFFKQWGTWGADEIKRNKKANGRLFLDKIWEEEPIVSLV